MFQIDVGRLPFEYWLCAVLLLVACLFAVRLRRELWAPPFIAVIGTVAAWYMVEPIYFEDFLSDFTPDAASAAYRCLLIFLITLIAATPLIVRLFRPRDRVAADQTFSLHPDQFVPGVVFFWLFLLAFGVYRMEGSVFVALFPVEGRAGLSMWGRGAAEDAGVTGFIVSTGAYLYVLVLSLFGLLLPLTRKPTMRWLLIICIAVSWPYAFLQGSRNVTLAVVIPALAAYLLIGRRSLLLKIAIAVGGFIALDFAMRTILEFRNVGFEFSSLGGVEQTRHLGLNMASELIYIAGFIQNDIMDISHGWGYVSELLNIVPRAIWPNKPILGIDYAIARGFGGGESDIGVFATLSSGMVGQGVLNFGTWFGPFFAGLLMASWIGLLTRLRYQGGTARTALFLIGLGLTFNLGRDVTLLVLFPFVFGYFGVLLVEARDRRKRAQSIRDARVLALNSRGLAGSTSTRLSD